MNQIVLNYQPRSPFVEFHQRKERFAIMVCHRRAGKTVSCVAELILRALYSGKKNAKYAYIGPFRQQAKETAWMYLKDMTEGMRRGNPRESELRVTLYNGAQITIYGADNPDAFRGLYFDGVILDEFGDVRATLWNEVVLPCLIDRDGWAVMIGTVKGPNHFYKKWEEAGEKDSWYRMMLKAEGSPCLNERQMAILRSEMTPEAWDQEMDCNWFANIPGRYYADLVNKAEEQKRIGSFPYRPDLPVHAAADLGFSDSTAWWFWQVDEDGPVLINYEEDAGRPLDFYFEMLESLPYKVDEIWLPHDAKATSFQTGRTTIEQFIEKKFPVRMVPRQKVQHGIDAARMLLPKCRIDANNCYGGIEALRSYRRTFNSKTQQYDDKPHHDWASNGADAFRYFALVTDFEGDAPEVEIEQPKGYTLEELFADRESDWRNRIIRL